MLKASQNLTKVLTAIATPRSGSSWLPLSAQSSLSVHSVQAYVFSQIKVVVPIDEVEAQVMEVFKSLPNCNADKLIRTSAFRDIGLDSLDVVEAIVSLEEKFNVDIFDEHAEKIKNVWDITTIFHKELQRAYKKETTP